VFLNRIGNEFEKNKDRNDIDYIGLFFLFNKKTKRREEKKLVYLLSSFNTETIVY
jgi:hypothetical protein